MKLIYVSGPYSGDIDANIEKAAKIAAELWDAGHAVICPHLNTAHFELRCKVATYETYIAGDLLMVEACDGMVMVPGWEKSKGAVLEMEHAKAEGIPVWIYPDVPAVPKTVIVGGKEIGGGYPLCAGCENLTVTQNGWQCLYKPDTQECEYPEHLEKKLKDLFAADAFRKEKI